MATPSSVNDLKKTLRELVADPTAEARFRYWMAEGLVNAADTPGAMEFLLSVQAAFSDAAKGLLSPAKLRDLLDDLAKPSAERVLTPRQIVQFLDKSSSTGTSREAVPDEKGSEGRFVTWHLQPLLPAR